MKLKSVEDILQEIDNIDLVDNVAIYHNMANILDRHGKPDRALVMHQKALDIQLKALGPDHLDVAWSYHHMARFRMHQNKFEEAHKMHQAALNIRIQALGPYHLQVANSYNHLATVLLKQQQQGHDNNNGNNDINLEQALLMSQKSLYIRIKALGPDHPAVADSYFTMVSILCHHEGGSFLEQALSILQKALDIDNKALGPNHPAMVQGKKLLDFLHSEWTKQEKSERNNKL